MYQRVIPGQRLAIPAADYNAAMAAAEAHAKSGKSGAGDGRHGRGRMEYGKLDQSVTAGVQTGKTVSVWHGPAWGGSDAATGDVLPVDHSSHHMDSGTYVELRLHRGKWYATPYEPPPEVMIGKADGNISKGSAGQVSIYEGEPGSETDTGDDISAVAKARAITSGKMVVLTRMPGNQFWYVDCWES